MYSKYLRGLGNRPSLGLSSALLTSFVSLGFSFSSTIASANPSKDLFAQDLAIVLDLDGWNRGPKGYFEKSWWQSMDQAYRSTSVGEALRTESPYEDWNLVSMRFGVCVGLDARVSKLKESCWPEVRLVWQPVQKNIRLHEIFMPFAADDRAAHAIYVPEAVKKEDRAEAARLRAKLSAGQSLSTEERAFFEKSRLELITLLRDEFLALRDPSLPESSFTKHGLRAELTVSTKKQAFMQRLESLLSRYAQPKQLTKLTGFSLPEGREPAHLDEWVFIAFKAAEGASLKTDPITIKDPETGKVLVDLGASMRGTQRREDERLYEIADGSEGSEMARKIRELTLVSFDADQGTKNRIANDRLIQVPNTSCVSCHQLGETTFDFHNFSYLENREVSISPRVIQDVAWDMAHLKEIFKK